MTIAAARRDSSISPVFLGLVALAGGSAWVLWAGGVPATGVAVFLFVVAGWIVSLCLHEYAHARSALHSGDVSIRSKGYLTLNPLRYSHAVLSVILPVLFVIMGGIGLPGGAVFVERGRIRGRLRHSLISAAGPLTNALLAVLLTAPFWLGQLGAGTPVPFRCALALLAMLQVTAALVNLLPVPGLDGYGVLEPWLPHGVRRQVAPFAPFGLLAVFGLLWVPEVNHLFWDGIHAVMRALDVSELEIQVGLEFFRFWQGEPDGAFLFWSVSP